MSVFEWNRKTSDAAVMLAKGYTQAETAAEIGVTDRTIRRWVANPDFAAEVDRLSVMVDLAGRGERVRLAQRVIRRMDEKTERDLLDWLKFIQSETDGAKLDGGFIEQLAALIAHDSRPAGAAPAESAGATSADASAGDGSVASDADNAA